MQLFLYQFTGDNAILDKTSYLTLLAEYTGELKEASSILNPSILILDNTQFDVVADESGNEIDITADDSDVSIVNTNRISLANYIYIPEFNRYYFITDITSILTNLWKIDMHVDVLMSYKNQIKNLYAFVTRNEFSYYKYIKDDMVSYYYDKEVTEYVPIKGNKVNKTFNTEQSVLTNNIVLNVINEDIQLNLDYITSPDTSLPNISAPTTGDSMTSISYATYSTMITRLSKRLQRTAELSGFIISLMVFPFDIETQGEDHYLKLGATILNATSEQANDDVQVANLATQTSKYYIIADFTISSDSFLDYEPFTQYEIYLPYIGWVSMSADNILNNRIIVYYVVNYATGLSQVTIYDITNKKILYTGGCQLGVKLGINTTTQREVNDNRTSNGISLGVGLLTSAVSIIAGAVTYNPVAVVGGVLSSGSTIAKFVQNENTNYLRASGSVNSGQSGLYLPQDVRIRKTKMKTKNYNQNYSKLFGRPLNEYRKISSLSGFTTIGEIHIEDIESITSTEYNELYAILKSGFII